ncbi:MAG: gamma-mobile-trio protein GmtX [Clostridiaceae bacterium]|nr:gamma-mobile-trio protein GmtX [Clostridiaceae bacterium]
MAEISPDDLFTRLCGIASTRKKRTLGKVHEICKEQAGIGCKDFSLATIGGLLASKNILTEQALRNKNGEEYRALINCWADFTGGSIKKVSAYKTNSTNDNILAGISDPTIRAMVGITIAENKKLKNELSLLKQQTTLTLDMRTTSKNTENVVVVSPFHGLTDMEIEALRNAISDQLLNYQGWVADDYGRVKMKSSGVNIYKAGYVTAISKILENL